MADTKLSALTADASPTSDDLVYVVNDPGGTPASRKVTLANIKTLMSASPTLVTPTLGVASATTINKVALTAPATGSTLTIADGKTLTASNSGTLAGGDAFVLAIAAGKTLTASNSITLAGTDSTTMTFPPASASVGYLNVPQNSKSADYTTLAADAGKHILHPTADNNPRTFTIDSHANLPYAVGTVLTFINQINTVTIAITADTMKLAGAGTTGDRTLAANGIATAVKLENTVWIISGTGLT
jgi:hypothetical protein